MSVAPPPGAAPSSPPPRRPTPMTSATDRAFSRRAAVWLSVAGALSLLATLLMPALGGDDAPTRDTRGANAYSRSAVGHHAFVRFLRALDLPVLVSRHRSERKAGPRRPLIIAEPSAYDRGELGAMIGGALDRGAPVVVVLPKWDLEFFEDPAPDDKPALLPVADVADVLEVAAAVARDRTEGGAGDVGDLDDAILRPGDDAGDPVWDGDFEHGRGPRLSRPQLLDAAAVSRAVPFDSVMWDASVASGAQERVLIGGFTATELYVVSDPGLIETMGLGLGDNAVVAYRFLADYLGAVGVVIDEVVHGFKKPDSIWRELFAFPLVLLTLHLIGLLLLALWAAMSRFGKPAERPPRLPPGKATLIDNTASLLAQGGHVGYGLNEYLRATVRALARAYALPPRLGFEEQLAALDRLASARGIALKLTDLRARAVTVRDHRRDTRRAVQLARRIYRFRMEMLHGHRGD